MEQSDILTRERQKYSNLLEDVRTTCRHLKKGISKLDSVSNKVIKGYSIDDVSADRNYLEKTKEKAEDLYHQLKETVIPAIEQKIHKLSDDISDAIIKEKQEEEAKKENG